ncbi:hypothetical protein LCGC14_1094180 [marine sediment metagenome]|uniref:Uncharacterized protein n=1 Tax=marine sediment metagenome TaxID=412755 RepID=A0A0F9MZ60_9ZZZZ
MDNAEKILQEIIELLNGPEGIPTSQMAYTENVYIVVEDALAKYHELDAILDDIGNKVVR